MKTIFKLLVFLSLFCVVGLAGFSYFAPLIGVDMAPKQTTRNVPLAITIE